MTPKTGNAVKTARANTYSFRNKNDNCNKKIGCL